MDSRVDSRGGWVDGRVDGAVTTGEGRPHVPGYHLTEVLGSGAGGQVWRARQAGPGPSAGDGDAEPVPDDVAVKIVRSGELAERELAVLRGVRHAHVVGLREGVLLADGSLALVLDLVEGGTLAQLVAARGHLRPGEVVTVVAPLAGALAELHAVGIEHGDLAPGNVLFDRAGRPMLGDLGTVRITGAAREEQFGTPGYVDPVVVAGGRPGPASDVYGLGALAWFALTGRTPPGALLREPLADVVPGLPDELVAVLEEALDPDPSRRPAPDALARRVFDAAPAEPVWLMGLAPVDGGLTHRIRQLAAADERGAQPPRHRARTGRRLAGSPLVRRLRREPRSSRVGATSRTRTMSAPVRLGAVDDVDERAPATSRASAVPRARAGSRRTPARVGVRRRSAVAAATVVAVAVLVMVIGVVRSPTGTAGPVEETGRPVSRASVGSASDLTAAGGRAGARDLADSGGLDAGSDMAAVDPGGPATSSPPSGTTGTPSGAAAATVTDRSALTDHSALEVVQRLSELRARAFTEADASVLAAVTLPGSPADRQARADLDTLRQQGLRYRGVRLQVRSTRVRSSTPDSADVDVVTDVSAYAVADAQGRVTRDVPAQAGSTSRLRLVRTPQGWRVSRALAR